MVMSYAMLFIIKGWLLFSETSLLNYADCNISTSMILRPTILLWVTGIAILFNFISVFIPVWMATRRNIISTLKGE
jgi:putative ABC transport system permease protein